MNSLHIVAYALIHDCKKENQENNSLKNSPMKKDSQQFSRYKRRQNEKNYDSYKGYIGEIIIMKGLQ